MALLQVLALHKYTDRSEKGLADTMQGSPRSAATWEEVAQQHPEFFRVNPDTRLGVSLVSRHVMPRDDEGRRELPSEFTAILLKAAIDMHDRQWERAQQWKTWIPIAQTMIGGIMGLCGVILGVVIS